MKPKLKVISLDTATVYNAKPFIILNGLFYDNESALLMPVHDAYKVINAGAENYIERILRMYEPDTRMLIALNIQDIKLEDLHKGSVTTATSVDGQTGAFSYITILEFE